MTRYQQNKSLGLCAKCGQVKRPNRSQCDDCLERSQSSYYNRIARNECYLCGIKLETESLGGRCDPCRTTSNERLRQMRRDKSPRRKWLERVIILIESGKSIEAVNEIRAKFQL